MASSHDLFRAILVDSGRTGKPRDAGLTVVLDTGLGLSVATDLVETSGDHIDYVKVAWGSSLITGNLDAKLDVYHSAGVAPLLGGTLFEYAFLHGKLDEVLALVRETKLHIEVSDGSIDIPREDKLRWIERFSGVTDCWSEIGGKVSLHERDWRSAIRDELSAGATRIVVEGRQLGLGGRTISTEFVEELLEWAGGPDRLIWEALERRRQLFFLSLFGPNVNLANVRPSDVLTLESFRRGLKAHTLTAWLPRSCP